MICGLVVGKFANMNFDFICKISREFVKMGITFAYSDEKVFYMKNHLLKKLHPNLTGGTVVKSGQTVVKQWSN